MRRTIKAWECIGCGKLEAPQDCIGVCQDRAVELVYAADHAVLVQELAELQARHDALTELVARLAESDAPQGTALAGLTRTAKELLSRQQPGQRAAMSGTPRPGGGPANTTDNVDGSMPRSARPATLLVR